MYGDEASFWLDGTLHRTWARIGHQPYVDTFGMRKTAHVFGALSLELRPHFHYQFADVFKATTFLLFLKSLVRSRRRKIFLIIDNGPCHNLNEEGKKWLRAHREPDPALRGAQCRILGHGRRGAKQSPLRMVENRS
jgi:hypothetical protein